MFSNTKGQRSYGQVCIYFMGCIKDETSHQNNLLLCGAAEDGEVSGAVASLRIALRENDVQADPR